MSICRIVDNFYCNMGHRVENAKNMLKMNLGTIEQISKAVSLPLEQVMEIAEKLKAEKVQ